MGRLSSEKLSSRQKLSFKDYPVAYSYSMRDSLAAYFRRESRKLESVWLQIEPEELDAKNRRKLYVDRRFFPDAKLGDPVLLLSRTKKTDKFATESKGTILSLGESTLKVKLRKQVELEETEKQDPPDNGKTKSTKNDKFEPKKANDEPKESKDKEFRLRLSNKRLLRRQKRVNRALQRLERLSSPAYILNAILPSSRLLNLKPAQFYMKTSRSSCDLQEIHELSGQHLPPLTNHQAEALEFALKCKFCIIYGPESSGKSLIAANLASSVAMSRQNSIYARQHESIFTSSFKRNKRSPQNELVLLCSPYQSSVERAALQMVSSKQQLDSLLNTISLTPRSNEFELRLARYRNERASINYKQLNDLDDLIDENCYTHFNNRFVSQANCQQSVPGCCATSLDWDNKTMDRICSRGVAISSERLRDIYSSRVLATSHVVCTSLLNSGSRPLRRCKFDTLIVDDAHLATEEELLIAMMLKGFRRVVLFADSEYKLPSPIASQDGKRQAFVPIRYYHKLLARKNIPKFSLTDSIFNGDIQNNTNKILCNCKTSDRPLNATVKLVVDKVRRFKGCSSRDIGIISNTSLRPTTNSSTQHLDCKLGTIQDFVGLQKDYIILSCLDPQDLHEPTNNNESKNMNININSPTSNKSSMPSTSTRLSLDMNPDFCRDNNSLHVALTRATKGIIIVFDMEKSWITNYIDDKKSDETTNDQECDQTDSRRRDLYCDDWIKLVESMDSNGCIINHRNKPDECSQP